MYTSEKTPSSPIHDQASPGAPLERSLEGPGRCEQHRRQDWQQQQRKQRLSYPSTCCEHAVQRTGGCDPHGRGDTGHTEHRPPPQRGVVEDRHTDDQQRLEDQQLGPDGEHLPDEDRARIEPRQAKRVAHAGPGLDREGALHGDERREEHRHPEQPRCGGFEDAPVGVEREREQHQHQHREGQHLRSAPPWPAAPDAEVLDHHQPWQHRDLMPRSPPRSTTPPLMVTVRSTGHLVRRPHQVQLVTRREQHSCSCEATSTVAPAAASRISSSITSRPGCIEPGVGFVEQPQLGAAPDHRGERHPAPLPRRQGCTGRSQPAGDPEPVERRIGRRPRSSPRGTRPEVQVLGHRQVVVEERGVAQQADPAAHRGAPVPPGRDPAPPPHPS